jgi:hypothetical protein
VTYLVDLFLLNPDGKLIGKISMMYINNIIKSCIANVTAKLEIMEPYRSGFLFVCPSL